MPLEHTTRATAHWKHPKELVHGFANCPRVSVWPEVLDSWLLCPAHHLNTWKGFIQGDGQVRIALVIAVTNVEPWVVLLDPGVLDL